MMALCFAGQARGAFTLSFQESDGNVVATGSGSIDTSALSVFSSLSEIADLDPAEGLVFAGPTSAVTCVAWSGITGPSSLGSGDGSFPTSGSGDFAGVLAGDVYLPSGYVSEHPLSDTTTWTGATYSTLGLSPGSYTYTWGTGPSADSLTVTMDSVPEPACLGLAGIAGMVLVLGRRRRLASV
jgi:hypothetical protein